MSAKGGQLGLGSGRSGHSNGDRRRPDDALGRNRWIWFAIVMTSNTDLAPLLRFQYVRLERGISAYIDVRSGTRLLLDISCRPLLDRLMHWSGGWWSEYEQLLPLLRVLFRAPLV